MNNKILKNVLLLIFLLLITTPYFLANFLHPEGLVFGGFLQNPLDGNSYLAKMREGYDGNWLFFLPFTSEKGDGTFLFAFYLFLGHLARISGLPLLLIFHTFRIGCSILLFFSVEKFLRLYLPDDTNIFNEMFAVCMFGSGLGSIAYFATGEMTADFWVAEAFPFLSAYSNPHFPLGVSLLLFILIRYKEGAKTSDYFCLSICTILLAIILPFAFVIGFVVIGLKEFIKVILSKKIKTISPVLYCLIGGLLFLIYQQWIATHDPLLVVWNQQNVTASPHLWDILISLSPVLIFSIIGIIQTIKHKYELDIPIIWVVVSLVFLIIPISLQRRFMLGIFIPLTVLAGRGLFYLIDSKQTLKIASLFVLVFSLLTNIVILAAGFSANMIKNPKVFLTEDEKSSLNWLDENSGWDDIVLASPELSMYIPGWAGARVVYGHPFETVDAVEKEKGVKEIFKSFNQSQSIQDYIKSNEIKFVIYGPREQALNVETSINFPKCAEKYSNKTVEIFQCQ
jgi:hypothetical protein